MTLDKSYLTLGAGQKSNTSVQQETVARATGIYSCISYHLRLLGVFFTILHPLVLFLVPSIHCKHQTGNKPV